MPTSTTPAKLIPTFAGGVLTIGPNAYSLTQLPASTSPLVLAQKSQVTANLNIADMMDDLSMSVKLIYLAYCGVAGTGDLAANVAKRQNELLTVCSSCLTMAQTIQRKTKNALADLLEAFTILLDENFADESEALAIFTTCGEYAEAIASECRKTAQKVNTLTAAIGNDATLTEKTIGTQNAAIRELKKLQGELESTLAKQASLAKSLEKSLEDLQKDIAEAKEDERTESKRAFITGIVSAVSGAIGAGVGALAGAVTGVTTTSRATAAVAQITKPVPRPEDDSAVQASKDEVEKASRQ